MGTCSSTFINLSNEGSIENVLFSNTIFNTKNTQIANLKLRIHKLFPNLVTGLVFHFCLQTFTYNFIKSSV